MLKQFVHRIGRLFSARTGRNSAPSDARSGKGMGCAQLLDREGTRAIRVQPVDDSDGPAKPKAVRRNRDPLVEMLSAARSR